jgi:TatA/E family protein of Tat protein translocase
MIEGLLRPSHLLLIFLVALFVFGPKKLPELGKGFGSGHSQLQGWNQVDRAFGCVRNREKRIAVKQNEISTSN